MDLNRREFVAATAAAAAMCSCGGIAEQALAADVPKIVDVGAPPDFPKDGVSDKFAKSDKIFVIRKDEKIFATSAICTHRSCSLKVVESELRCPCHGSRFSAAGNLVKGPATEALPHLGVEMVDGKIKVNTGKTFTEKQWNDPQSFIKVPTS